MRRLRSPRRAVWAHRNGYRKIRLPGGRTIWVPGFAITGLAAVSITALGYFLAVGSGTGKSAVGTLNAPTITTATPGLATVQLAWTTVAPPLGVGTVTYHVTRDGIAAGGNCPTATAPTTVTSCTDSGMLPGSHVYTVTAHWKTFTATSESKTATVVVATPVATHLVLSTPNPTFPAGQAQSLTITAKDASENTVATYTGGKNLTFSGAGSIGSNNPTVTDSAGAARTFGTTEPINFIAGTATVLAGTNGSMVLYKAETAKIVVSDGSISNGTGLSVTVNPAASSKLVFSTQPGSAAASAPLDPQPAVTVQDTYGNTGTSDTSNVTLAIGTNPGSGALSCNTNPRVAVAGVATFAGCAIDKPGVGYTLRATDGALTAATSSTFNVTSTPLPIATGNTVSRNSTGTLSPPLPNSLAANDLMILVVANTRSSIDFAPGGWTAAGSVGTSNGSDIDLSVYYRLYQAGDAAPTAIVITDSGGASARVSSYRYVNTTTPIDTAPVTNVSAAGQTTFTPTGLATSTANARALSIVAENGAGNTPPSLSFSAAQGFTAGPGFPDAPSVGDNANHHAVFSAGKLVPAAAGVVLPTYTSNFAGTWAGVSLALRP